MKELSLEKDKRGLARGPFLLFKESMSVKKNYITLLGVGNILMADEGFGVHFVRWFSGRYGSNDRMRVVDGGVLGYGLFDIICGCEKLIVVDVLKADDSPGSVYRLTREEMELRMPPPTSAHEVTFPDVLFKAELIEELPETIFICIVPENFSDMRLEMTPALQERFPIVEKVLLRELERLNHYPERI